MIPKHRNKHTHTKSQPHSNTRISLNILFCNLQRCGDFKGTCGVLYT